LTTPVSDQMLVMQMHYCGVRRVYQWSDSSLREDPPLQYLYQ